MAGAAEDGGVLSDPVLNGPYDLPERHFEIGRDGPTGLVLPGRRRSESWVPVPRVRKSTAGAQQALDFDLTGERRQPNPLINGIREQVDRWRRDDFSGATPISRTVLRWWSDPTRGESRVLFCQREAVETAIFLAEISGRGRWSGSEWRTSLEHANAEHNEGLPRTALKMATGSGKTVVMAMLIAWQTLNHAHAPRDARFTDRFLVVTPGITIRDRLRVLLPTDEENYYRLRDLVPPALWGYLTSAQVFVTNYHAFLPRDSRDIKGVSSTTRAILAQGHRQDPFRETDDDVVSRILKEFPSGAGGRGKGGPRLMVLNDEAHHCYVDRPVTADGADRPDAEGRERNEQARVWFRGLRAIQRKVGLKAVYDLSATPYYLGGSGYTEGFIFPWVVSDFSLMDAIESGIVKVPRLPVDDDAAGAEVTYLRLWDAVGPELPKRKARTAVSGAGWTPPKELEGALRSLYRSYGKAWQHYEEHLAPLGQPPPVFIVVCPNTVVSRLVHDWVAGHEVPQADGEPVLRPGQLRLFSNVVAGRWERRPRTLLIDSARLESGEALSKEFKDAASAEINVFHDEYRRRFPGADVERLTDEDLLREVMNTVGKPGRLGGDVRCVVSVAMLTEGWDANTVTHVLGIRAFGSQLLCEQVVGRGLRRRSYALNEDGRFDAEYADVYGVPFTFLGGEAKPEGPPRPPALEVFSVPGREPWRIRFPHVVGYRVEVPDAELHLDLKAATRVRVSRDKVATWTRTHGVIGSSSEQDLIAELERVRPSAIAFQVASEVVDHHLRMGEDRRPWLFPRVLEATRTWLAHNVDLEEGLPFGFLTLAECRREASEAVAHALTSYGDSRGRLRPLLRPLDTEGSTAGISFLTRKAALPTDEKCELSHVVLDGPGGNTWEQILMAESERHPDVAAYVKNDHVGLAVPYVHLGVTHDYVPDFLVRLHRRERDVERTLVVEVSGGRKSPGPAAVKARTARDTWCAAVNNHGGFGRWGYVEITEMPSVRERFDEAVRLLYNDAAIVGDPDVLDVVT